MEDNKQGARYAENIVTWEISDATPISATHVSLGPKNESVRAALSQEFREYLKGLHMWLEHIANLHHAVADEVAYKDFETKMSENIKRTYDRLSAEPGTLQSLVRCFNAATTSFVLRILSAETIP